MLLRSALPLCRARAAHAATAAAVTTVAGGGKGAARTNVELGKTTATSGGMGFAKQEDWTNAATRSAESAGERAEQAAEKLAGDVPPQFGLHRAGLGFDLSSLADAIRSSWGGRATDAAQAVAQMVRDPSAARRLPFPPPRQKKEASAEKDEEDELSLELPLRWRRMSPDAANDEWWELPSTTGEEQSKK